MIRDADALQDIRHAAAKVVKFTVGMGYEVFFEDEKTQDACIRQLEIIGEAAKRLGESTRLQYKRVAWKEWAGLRDILIHAYDKVDPEEVWKTIQEDLPLLRKEIG